MLKKAQANTAALVIYDIANTNYTHQVFLNLQTTG
jgi:hypothetical protein